MRNRFVLLLDLPLIAIAAFGAFAARFDWRFYEQRPEFQPYVVAALIIKPAIFLALGLYGRYWRYASIQELQLVVIGVMTASVGMAVFVTAATLLEMIPSGFSRVVFLNDCLLTLIATGGLRLAVRVVHESRISGRRRPPADAKRVLIVGAGAAGTMVARETMRNRQLGLQPIGFVDDDAVKAGKRIAGLRVFGPISTLPDIIRDHGIDRVVIAMPTARGSVVRAIHDVCSKAGVTSQTIPGVFELLDGQVRINRLRNVDIADLLRRAPVGPPGDAASFVVGRVVMITGGGGSIGSELARQIANAGPARLVLLGHGENSIFEAEARLRSLFPNVTISTVIADIRDDQRLAGIFDAVKPAIVFHAAAHKHVPLMEENPEEAVTNNITGTRNVVRHALRSGTERFVLISTDKAVAPTSVMGATKRIAEWIVGQAAQSSGRAFVSVRFGNVLGSRGSVVNLFKVQIEQGGPVTVTHPEMTRYFMTIPEAVHLVLQASAQGRSGDLFVLDMGEPVRIVDLAKDLIRLSGLHEDEIPIVFTGARPGEKLHEVLFDTGMQSRPTANPGVLQVVGYVTGLTPEVEDAVLDLEHAARLGKRTDVEVLLQQLFPALDRRHVPAKAAMPATRPSIH